MTAPERLVLDCNVYFQALLNSTGPANRLLSIALKGQTLLYASEYVLEEFSGQTNLATCTGDGILNAILASNPR